VRRALGLAGLPALIGLIAAASSPESWLRRGNAVFERGDYHAALECYARAMDESSDPGQVAFNAAAAHYQLGDYSNAELNYRRSLEDAPGARKVRALYGLGNALAQQGRLRRGRHAIALLQAAIENYQSCQPAAAAIPPLEQDAVRETLENADFNRNLVKMILKQKLADAVNDTAPPNDEKSDERPIDDRPSDTAHSRDRPRNNAESNGQKGSRESSGGEPLPPHAGQPQSSDETQPGKGNLPPLSDDAHADPLDPEQALDYLQRNLDRIRRERSRRATTQDNNVKGLRDW
jgi:tetratricopeptide (TPR) repeat protein